MEGRKLVERATKWLLRNRPLDLDIRANTRYFLPGLTQIADSLDDLLAAEAKTALEHRRDRFSRDGVAEGLSNLVSAYNELVAGLDIVRVSELTEAPVEQVAAIYYRIGADLDLHWIRDRIDRLPRGRRWQSLARASLREDLSAQHKLLTADVLQLRTADGSGSDLLQAWQANRKRSTERYRGLIAELKALGEPDISQLSAAMREIRGLHRGELDVKHGDAFTESGNKSEAAA